MTIDILLLLCLNIFNVEYTQMDGARMHTHTSNQIIQFQIL